jgi:uncharacterized membrane protein
MDKIIALLESMQNEITALRADVRALDAKITQSGSSIKETLRVADAPAAAPDSRRAPTQTGVNYGRALSPSEQAYLQKLHGDTDATQSAHDGQSERGQRVPEAPAAPAVTLEPSVVERFMQWFAKDWPMKVGGFFIIAAVGWFVTYAAKVGWLSETARVTLGYIFAVVCIAFGTFRAEKVRVQGNLFLIIGISAMLIATLAGMAFDLFVPVVGLFVMLFAVGCVTLISLRQKSFALTGSMIFFGTFIPLFFFVGVDINMIFTYLFVLTVGTLWIVSFTQWRGLTVLMLAAVAFYSFGYMINAYGSEVETVTNIAIAFLFTTVFYIANVSSIIRSSSRSWVDHIVAIGIGLLFLIWMLSFSPREVEVVMLLIGVVGFAGASFLVFSRTGDKTPTAIYGGVSAALFAVATALQFDGPVLVTAYLVEAAAFVIVALYLAHGRVSQATRMFLVIIYSMPVLMSLVYVAELFDRIARTSVDAMASLPALFAVVMVAITAFAAAIGVLRQTDVTDPENMTFFRMFAYIGGVFTVLLVWFVTHLFMGNFDVATFVSLVIYTITGVAFYVIGARESYKPYMMIGGVLFGIVVARVLFVEFWEMDIVIRFITSFVLGILLISTAFIRLSHKK